MEYIWQSNNFYNSACGMHSRLVVNILKMELFAEAARQKIVQAIDRYRPKDAKGNTDNGPDNLSAATTALESHFGIVFQVDQGNRIPRFLRRVVGSQNRDGSPI